MVDGVHRAAHLMRTARHTVALTGAGLSTESGIPDFRSPGGVWARFRPIEYQEFLASHEARIEHWRYKCAARSSQQAGNRASDAARGAKRAKMPRSVSHP